MFNRGKKDDATDSTQGNAPSETPLPLRPVLQAAQRPETPPSPTPTPTTGYRPDLARRAPEPVAPVAPRAPTPTTAASAAAQAVEQRRVNDTKKLIVGREIELNGKITSCDLLIVEGKVEAALSDTRAVEIADTGIFKGTAEIEEAEISGRFDGTLSVRGRLLIRATGRVTGEVRYGQLEIECGGELSGQISVVGNTTGLDLRRAAEPALVEQPGV